MRPPRLEGPLRNPCATSVDVHGHGSTPATTNERKPCAQVWFRVVAVQGVDAGLPPSVRTFALGMPAFTVDYEDHHTRRVDVESAAVLCGEHPRQLGEGQ